MSEQNVSDAESLELTFAQNVSVFEVIARIIWFRLCDIRQTEIKLRFDDHFTTPYGIPECTKCGIIEFCKGIGWEVIEFTSLPMIKFRKIAQP